MSEGQANKRTLITGDYPALEWCFVREVKAARTKDRFNPLLILVSSKLLGLHLRRLLAENGMPHFNLRFRTVEEFAREVGAPHLLGQGKTQVPPHADELMVGSISKSLAAKDRGFYFHDITDHPGFHRAVLATLKDLKDASLSPKQMEPLLADTKTAKQVHLRKVKDLLILWKVYEKRLQDLGWYDESDVMVSACQHVKDSTCLIQAQKMIIYGFYDFNMVQKRLLQSCFNEKETIVFLPYEPERAFEYVKPTRSWLKDNSFKETSAEVPEPNKGSRPLDHLCRHLFDDGKPAETSPDVVQIISSRESRGKFEK